MTVLVTGATGMVGAVLVTELLARGESVRVLVRDRGRAEARWGDRVEVVVQDLARAFDATGACERVERVLHLAGDAHADDRELRHEVTIAGTRALLANAAAHGVERFVFLSSVKAIGEATGADAETGDAPAPTTAYGRSRRAAEQDVLASASPRGAVLRVPLLYGPGVKGNLRGMIDAIASGWFPPLPDVANRRSLLDVRDAVAALRFVAVDDRAVGRALIATDGEAYSSRRIYEAVCHAVGRPTRSWSVPPSFLRAAGWLGDRLGRGPLTSEKVSRLLGHAHYANGALVALGWRPRHRLETSLPEMVARQ